MNLYESINNNLKKNDKMKSLDETNYHFRKEKSVEECDKKDLKEKELVKPTPEEEEFFDKNEDKVWAEYASRLDIDLKSLEPDNVDYDLLLQCVRDLIESLDTGLDESEEYSDSDEAEYYRNKELYSNSHLDRHREVMEKAKKACEEKGIKLDEDKAESRLNDRKEKYEKDLQYVKDIMDGKEVTDDKYNEPLDLETAKKWLKDDYIYINSLSSLTSEEVNEKIAKDLPEIFGGDLKEEFVEVLDPRPKRDYVITDITVLEPVGDGDVRAIDVQELLATIDESLSEKYGTDWGHINIVTSRKTLSESSATFELRLKESNYAMNFIVSGENALKEFQVYTTMGKQIYNKKTMNVIPQMEAYIEQFLDIEPIKEDDSPESNLDKTKTKKVIEEYIKVSGNRESSLLLDTIEREIKFYKEMKKELGEENESVKLERETLQSLIHRIVSLLPLNIADAPEEFKKLNLGTIPDLEEVLFGEFIEEGEEKPLKESYQVYNIGNMQVVYNPNTQDVTYSIDSEDIQDKRINLTKIPSVEIPYNTETIIKNYIEKQVGAIAQDGDEEKIGPNKEVPVESESEVTQSEEKSVEEPVEEDDNLDVEEKPLEEPSDSETGSAIFIRKPKTVDQIRDQIDKGLNNNKSTYIVAKTLTLSPDEFKELGADLTKPQEYFKDVDVIDGKNYAFNVIEITDGTDTLLIDNAGSDFAKYVAIK